MPQLVFKGIRQEDVCKLSLTLAKELAEISDTPEDYFTLEYAPRVYYAKGEQMKMYPLVEVLQFKRADEVEEKMARHIQKRIYELQYQECEVYFLHIHHQDYYE